MVMMMVVAVNHSGGADRTGKCLDEYSPRGMASVGFIRTPRRRLARAKNVA